MKVYKLEDLLNILSTGFLKGGSGFLKAASAGEMIKGSGSINREIRVGVTHVSRKTKMNNEQVWNLWLYYMSTF